MLARGARLLYALLLRLLDKADAATMMPLLP